MAGKRKTASTSIPASGGSVAPAEDAEEGQARPEVTLRRHSRRLTEKKHDEDESKTREIQGKILGPRPSGKHKTNDDLDEPDVQGLHEQEEEGMKLAMEGLQRMERRLQERTKRRKRQVEESDDRPPTPPPRSRTDVATHDNSDDDYKNDAQVDVVDEPPNDLDRGPSRPPPVNSGYLPLPWKGRLGYACLNTYLRAAKPSVFSSRTCRLDSILKHRHPLRDPSQPEHATKNRPDETQAADPERGQWFVQELGLANTRDIIKMLRWNDKYNIKLFRLSSEMFPFASHAEHGYKLASFASDMLAEAGKVAAELGHRLTTHPGQYTQLGSPRKEVVAAAVRDLEYHDEMLTLLRLPEQQNRDAVMILHMGGTFEGKAETLDRFRKNYAKLSPSIKARLVLENDDVGWGVHDILPICEELNIPLVLDYHHHNIVFDASKCREGTLDISSPDLAGRITQTWSRKGIKQKMHYSEPCAGATMPRERRKHSPRVATLPPCPDDMDLMIEAKDKEQAVFELMRNFKLPGFERIADMVPFVRVDERIAAVPKNAAKDKARAKGGGNKRRKGLANSEDGGREAVLEGFCFENEMAIREDDEIDRECIVSEKDFGMGGKEGRVYWPPGREDWLKPEKRKVGFAK